MTDWPPRIEFDDDVIEELMETTILDVEDLTDPPDHVVEVCSGAAPYPHAVGAMQYCIECETPRMPGDAECPWCEEPWAPAEHWTPCTVVSGCDAHKAVGFWTWVSMPAQGCRARAAWMCHPDVRAANPNRCGEW